MHSLALMRLVSFRSFGNHFFFPPAPPPQAPFAYRLSFFRILIFQACVFPMLLLRLVREFFLHPLFSFFQMFRLTLYFSSFLLRVLLGLSSELLLLPLF